MEKIKKTLKLKNIITLLVICILSVISMLNFSVALYANNKNEVSINLKEGDIIDSIILSKNALNLNSFQSDSILVEEVNEDEIILNVIKDTTINISMSVIDDLNVNISSSSEKIGYRIDNKEFENIGTNIYITNSKVDIFKNSLNAKSILIFGISFIAFCIIIYLFKFTLKRISEDKIRIWNIALFLTITFLIYLSNIYLFMLVNKMFAIIPALILCIYVLGYFKFSIKEWKNIFLIVSSIIGVMMIFIITPGNVPDEASHFDRAYIDSVSSNQEWKDNAKMPVSINNLTNKFTHDVHSEQVKYSGNSYMTELFGDNDYSTLVSNNTNYENTKYLSFLPYLPATIICFICRNLRLPVLITFLLCRLGNLIISTILCYLAIKNTPKFKKIFVLIAMLPIFLQQAAGVNMDYLTNSVALIFIAVILKYRFEDIKLDIKRLMCIFGIGLALGLCKFGYFPLLILICLIPNKNFKNKRIAIIFKLSLMIIPIIMSYFANFSAVSNPNTNTEEMYTMKSVLLNPINSAKICIKTFITRFAADSFCGLINGFGWSTKYQIELALWTIGAVYILFMFIDNEDSLSLKKKDRIIMLIVCAFIYLILYGVAFTEWTSILSDRINGLQSRYFIPILPLLYISISNNFFKTNLKDKWKLYIILMFIAQLLSVISILTSFY